MKKLCAIILSVMLLAVTCFTALPAVAATVKYPAVAVSMSSYTSDRTWTATVNGTTMVFAHYTASSHILTLGHEGVAVAGKTVYIPATYSVQVTGTVPVNMKVVVSPVSNIQTGTVNADVNVLSGAVSYMTTAGGIGLGQRKGVISGGTFNGEVTNSGTIQDGNFVHVNNRANATISGGYFESAENYGSVAGGTFESLDNYKAVSNGSINVLTNEEGGTVNGGTVLRAR